MQRKLWILLLAIGLGPVLTDGAWARTWRVEKDGSGDYTVIQEAVDAAAAGDTVLVGPGRYVDFRQNVGSEVVWSVLQVQKPDLTVIGAHRDSVILGPETPLEHPTQVYDAVRLEPGSGLHIQDLTIVNTGAAFNCLGALELSNLVVAGHDYGIFDSSDQDLVITGSEFRDFTEQAVLKARPGKSLFVQGCTFTNSVEMVSVIGDQVVTIQDCTFEYTGPFNRFALQMSQSATGTVSNCRFKGLPNYTGVSVLFAQATVVGCTFEESYTPIIIWNGHLQGSGNLIKGGSRTTLWFTDHASADFHGNDIYRTTGSSVLVDGYSFPGWGELDLTNNYWGTTDRDSIEAGFEFMLVDPELGVEVLYEPFRDGPVPVGRRSVGGFKAGYRR